MQADEDFNIRFVNLVRTHKCLYDKKVPEYRNRWVASPSAARRYDPDRSVRSVLTNLNNFLQG